MALPVIPDTFRLTWNYTIGGSPKCVSVTHLSAPGKTDAQLHTALEANVVVAMFNYLSTSYQCASVDIIRLDGSSSTFTHTFAAAKPGQCGGDILPQVCGVMTWQTLQRGPQGRGRMFQGPSGETGWNGGFVSSSTQQTGWHNAWTTFNNAMTTAGFQPVVASYKHLTTYGIQNARANAYSGTQRRRMEALH